MFSSLRNTSIHKWPPSTSGCLKSRATISVLCLSLMSWLDVNSILYAERVQALERQMRERGGALEGSAPLPSAPPTSLLARVQLLESGMTALIQAQVCIPCSTLHAPINSHKARRTCVCSAARGRTVHLFVSLVAPTERCAYSKRAALKFNVP